MPGLLRQDAPTLDSSSSDHLYTSPRTHPRRTHMSVAPASHVSSWSRPIWYHAGPPPSGTYDAIPPTPPPPPPPYGPVLQKVWILDCRSCGKFLTNRGMKAVLLLRPSVSLYSTDALPTNCSPYAEAAIQPSSSPPSGAPPRTCECLTQTLCCHGCGNSVGYMIVVPCARCTQSVGSSQRATNGHRFVFHAAEIAASERHYVLGEESVVASPTATAPAPTTHFAFSHSATSLTSMPSTNLVSMGTMTMRNPSLPPITSSSAAPDHGGPMLDPQRISPSSYPQLSPFGSPPAVFDNAERPELNIDGDSEDEYDDSMLDEPSFEPAVSHRIAARQPRSPSLSPSALVRRATLHADIANTPSSRARELLYARAQVDAHRRHVGQHPIDPATHNLSTPYVVPPHVQDRPRLHAGDVVYWHNLVRGGEISGAREDPRARQSPIPIALER